MNHKIFSVIRINHTEETKYLTINFYDYKIYKRPKLFSDK